MKDYGGYDTQVIGPALRGTRTLKKYYLIVGLGLFCGLFAGLAWAGLAELAGKRQPTSAAAS